MVLCFSTAQAEDDPATGLVIDQHWQLVASQCTVCHSARLVSQNRMNRRGWHATIKWMQKKHNLWPLGENESLILDYLEKHYNITGKAWIRRKNLVDSL
jgi:hypothetical protein